MKEFENRHYSEKPGHKERSKANREMLDMERKGLSTEDRYTIRQHGMRRIRRDGK